MALYTVMALEKFLVQTIYKGVEASSPEEAEKLVREGKVAYDRHEIQEGEEEFFDIVSCEEE